MTIAIITPWRGGCHHREKALAFIRSRIEDEHPDAEHVPGFCRSAEWCKAEAVADALTRTGAETLILWDADVWADPAAVHGALEHLYHRWAIPHRTVHRLDREATTRVYQTGLFRGGYDRLPYPGMAGGGLVVIDRKLYERAPFDPRFHGWGHEDESAGRVWRLVGGEPWRGSHKLWHLWHPPQTKLSRAVGSRESYELLRRYRGATTVEQVESILQEATDGVQQLR